MLVQVYKKEKNKISVQTNEVGFNAIFKLDSRERNKVLINLGGYKIPIVYAGIINRMNAISNSIVRTNKTQYDWFPGKSRNSKKFHTKNQEDSQLRLKVVGQKLSKQPNWPKMAKFSS